MGKQWAKVFRDVTSSDRLTALLAKNGFAEALYWRLKAMADDFGRYYGDAAEVATGICPRNIIHGHFRLKKVEQALADMEACGLVRFYEVGGRKYLEIVDYLSHAHEKWSSVGKPEHPAPLDWTPPPSLVEWLVEHAKAKNVSPGRFGVCIENWPAGIQYPFNTHSEGIRRVSNRLDVDSDSDRDSDSDLYSRGYALYCQARHGDENDPSLEMEYSNVCGAYGEEATFMAATIASATFAGKPEKPAGGSVTSYLMQCARTQAEKLKQYEGDEAMRAFLVKHGERPADPFGIAKWDEDLREFRAAQEVAG